MNKQGCQFKIGDYVKIVGALSRSYNGLIAIVEEIHFYDINRDGPTLYVKILNRDETVSFYSWKFDPATKEEVMLYLLEN